MNILVISEKFSKGGLETHINSICKSLSEKHNFFYAFGAYQKNEYLNSKYIYDGLDFSPNQTVRDFIETVNKLIDIIKRHKIDVIHAHPYYSIFAAAFAANICNIRLVYTYHGFGSLNFVSNIVDTSLFLFLINRRIDETVVVNSNALEYFHELHSQKVTYIPNLLDENLYEEHKPKLNKKWAIIARLDDDKYTSILSLFEHIDLLPIKKIDIYGSGNRENDIKKFIKDNKLSKKVSLKGYIYDLNKELKDYTGIIGIGRVALESLCMNYPTMLLGFNKNSGIINEQLYESVKDYNFVSLYVNEADYTKIKTDIESINEGNLSEFQFRDKVIKDFGLKNMLKYDKVYTDKKKVSISELNKVFQEIQNVSNLDENFFSSIEVMDVIKDNIQPIVQNPYYKIILNLLRSNASNIIMLNNLNKCIEYLNNENMRINKQINELYSKINDEDN